MALAISRRVVPRARRDLIRRSRETLGSPFSILAVRDWLDWSRRANSSCLRWLFSRRRRPEGRQEDKAAKNERRRKKGRGSGNLCIFLFLRVFAFLSAKRLSVAAAGRFGFSAAQKGIGGASGTAIAMDCDWEPDSPYVLRVGCFRVLGAGLLARSWAFLPFAFLLFPCFLASALAFRASRSGWAAA